MGTSIFIKKKFEKERKKELFFFFPPYFPSLFFEFSLCVPSKNLSMGTWERRTIVGSSAGRIPQNTKRNKKRGFFSAEDSCCKSFLKSLLDV
jgi:hypothetical protein